MRPPKPHKPCIISNCEGDILAKGYCRFHYRRNYRGDELTTPKNGSEHRATHPLYNRYRSMIRRCYSDYHTGYEYYGGRGITVCERWRGKNGFTNFVLDMGVPDDLKLTLDRINSNGNYEPSNVRWATSKQQNRNMRSNNMIGYEGKTMCLTDWATYRNINLQTLTSRINRYGWSIKRALEYDN